MRVIGRLDAPARKKVAVAARWCRERESNPQESSDPVDFESTAAANSAIPAAGAGVYGGRVRRALGTASGPDDNAADEVLPRLRRDPRAAHPRRRPPAATRLPGLRRDPLPQPADHRRLRAGA